MMSTVPPSLPPSWLPACRSGCTQSSRESMSKPLNLPAPDQSQVHHGACATAVLQPLLNIDAILRN